MEGIGLVDVITREDFLKELARAAVISYGGKIEAGFLAYTDEEHRGIFVNKAYRGGKSFIYSELDPEFQYPEGKGMYIPMGGLTLTLVHFHDSIPAPSYDDIDGSIELKRVNVLLEEQSGMHRECTGEQERVVYINPVMIICSAKGGPSNLEVLVYQGRIEQDITMDDFNVFVADYCKRRHRAEYAPADFLVLRDFPICFRTTRQAIVFLIDSGYFEAERIKIINGEISKRDLKKLERFQLKQARIF